MEAEKEPLDPIIGAILDGNQVAWPWRSFSEATHSKGRLRGPYGVGYSLVR